MSDLPGHPLATPPPSESLLLPSTPPPRKRKLWPWLAGAAILAVVLVVGAITLAVTRDTAFESAHNACSGTTANGYNPKDVGSVQLGDGGGTLVIDGAGRDGNGASLKTIACYLKALKTPDSVISKMDGTRALDGRQAAEWDGIAASWTYHPDQGINITLTLQ